MSRRDRKRRNQRIGAAVLAIVIAVAGVGVFVSQYRGTSHQPETPTITPQNVAQLRAITSDTTFPQQGFRMATGDGVLAMATSKFRSSAGSLIAYPFPCGGSDIACVPRWHVKLDGPGLPTISGGYVYVTGLRNTTLSEFPTDCGSGDAACTTRVGTEIGDRSSNEAPLVVDGNVYVGTVEGVRGFDANCHIPNLERCLSWIAPTDLPVRALAYADGILYVGTGRAGQPDHANVGTINAYRVSCDGQHGMVAACLLWTRHVGQVWDLTVDGGSLFVGTNGHTDGVQAYSTSCIAGGGSCRPLWVAATDCCTQLTAADGTIYADDQIQHTYAFPENCASNGSTCAPRWTSAGILGQPFVDFKRPLVAGGVVFVGGDEGWIYAFPESCQGSCDPAWRSLVQDRHGTPGNWDAVTLGDRLYVATAEGLQVFSTGEQAQSSPTSSSAGSAPLFYGGVAVAAAAILVIRSVRRRRTWEVNRLR